MSSLQTAKVSDAYQALNFFDFFVFNLGPAVAAVRDDGIILSGKFYGYSELEQLGILLHELAHLLGLAPANEADRNEYSRMIEKNCGVTVPTIVQSRE